MRFLVLEADEELGEQVVGRLVDEGHLVDHALRLQDARSLSVESYDALIVSWQLPDGPGLPWLAELRERGMGTVAVVLARHARPRCAPDPVQAALAAGANDCLIMPRDIALLAARIRDARLRASGLSASRLLCGDVELDLGHRRAFRGGIPVTLTGREWNLVEALALRLDGIVPKSELALLVHGSNASPASTAFEVHLSHVRRKLGRNLIRTVRGAGYLMST